MFKFFLLYAVFVPLAGLLLRRRATASLLGGFFAIRWLLMGGPLTFGIPSACAAANWSFCSQRGGWKSGVIKFFLNVFLPISCIALFVFHPVGGKAFFYSCFWLIPISAYGVQLFRGSSLFLTSLSSTFIAHAVGSVMWLYMIPTIPEKWIALLPIVTLERLACALGGVITFAVGRSLISFMSRKKVWARFGLSES